MLVRSRVRMIPWRRAWQPTVEFLLGESQGQRSLVDYSPWGSKRVRHDWATKQQQKKPEALRMTMAVSLREGQVIQSGWEFSTLKPLKEYPGGDFRKQFDKCFWSWRKHSNWRKSQSGKLLVVLRTRRVEWACPADTDLGVGKRDGMA